MPVLRPTTIDLGEGPVLRLVRDPNDGTPLPAVGRDLPLTTFWRRRLRDGDVEIVPDNDAAEAAAPAASGEEAAPTDPESTGV